MQIELISTSLLKPYDGNARTHSAKQIKQIAKSIERFGFTNPILIGSDEGVIAGHGRLAAAKQLGMAEVPTVRLSHLTSAERRAYVIADNKLALEAGWDQEILAIELQSLIDVDFDLDLTGFSMAEIDITLDSARQASADLTSDDVVPAPVTPTISRLGDVWHMGRHRLICGDAQHPVTFAAVLGAERADMVFTDPPYNVPVDGHVCGSGKVRHREFAFASGEMSSLEFTTFLATTLGGAAGWSRDGAIAFVCMDWRHMRELLDAGELIFDEFKQLCVWNKSNGGEGTFYRSKHELVFVFKVGSAPHINNFGLGETGRYRTNVWDYAGMSTISKSRSDDLAMHPTVKPVKMVIDAIEDCSRRGDIILDCFGGSGTTLIAAEQCGRMARLIEYDPAYCDVIIRRFQKLTGRAALRQAGGLPFDQSECRPRDLAA